MIACSEREAVRSDLLIAAALAVLAVLLAVVFFREAPETLAQGKSDLRVYLGAARTLAGPEPERLYDWAEQQREQRDWAGLPSPYANPPFVALLFVPLAHLPRLAALIATMLAESLALAAAMACASRLAGRRAWPLLALAVLAQPWTLQIWLSVQPAPLMTLLWAGFALAWTRGGDEWAAACVAAGLAIKPHLMIPLLLFLLFAARPRAVLVLAAGALLLGIGAWALVGTRGLERYPQMLAMLGSAAHWSVSPTAMVNLRGLLARTLGNTALSRALVLGLSGGVAAGIAWAGWRVRGIAPRPRRLEGNRLGESASPVAASKASPGRQPPPLRHLMRRAAGIGGVLSPSRLPSRRRGRGAHLPNDTLRAQAAVVALTGTMLASYHMHVQELPGLFVLAALCVAAGWLPRERLVSMAVYLVVGLWLLWILPGASLNLPPLLLLALYFFALSRCGARPAGDEQ